MPAHKGRVPLASARLAEHSQRLRLRPADRILFIAIGTLMVLVAAFNLLGIPADHANYVDFLTGPQAMNGTEELSLCLIVSLCSFVPSLASILFFLIYALLGVSLKLGALLRTSRIPLLSLLLYLPSYFLLHEYVQIRAAVAIGFFLLALEDHRQRNFVGYLSKTLMAMFFHWSSAIMLPLYLISKPLSRPLLLALPLLGLFLHILPLGSFMTATGLNGFILIQNYFAAHSGHSAGVNVFNVLSLFQLAFFFLFIRFLRLPAPSGSSTDDSFPLLEIQAVSLFCFYAFSALELPVIAFRLSEFLNVVLFLLIPLTVIRIKAKTALVLISGLYYLIYGYHLLVNTRIIPGFTLFAP